MPEILEQGEIPKEETQDFTCHNCKTVFRAKRSDGFSSQSHPMATYVSCPFCKKANYLYFVSDGKKLSFVCFAAIVAVIIFFTCLI